MSPPTEFQNGPDTVLERSCPFVVVQANPSISQAEIEEAYQWHDLFSKGYLTAHEMADLTSTDFPSTTGELFRVETENLQRIKQLIDQHLTDDEFRRHLAEIRALLPQPFRDMESMSSAWINPVDHTVDALAKLDTSGLTTGQAAVARVVLVFHDVGKVYDPNDREHPDRSANLAQDYLIKMGYGQPEMQLILNQIRFHDALGEAARQDGQGLFVEDDVLSIFPTLEELEIHQQIVLADVSSIPALRRFISNIRTVFRRLRTTYGEGNNSEELDVDLPEPDADLTHFNHLHERLFEKRFFSSVEISQDRDERKRKFAALGAEEQQFLLDFAIGCSQQNTPHLFQALQLTGRETDLTLVTELEEKTGSNLDKIRIAIYLFRLTYARWEADRLLRIGDQAGFTDVLKTLVDSARSLSSYWLLATHATTPGNESLIYMRGGIPKSLFNPDERQGDSHFEGEGVYTGIFGYFRHYNLGERFQFKIPLSQSLPILSSFNDPRAMACVLCEVVLLPTNEGQVATLSGVRQWLQDLYLDEPIEPWKMEYLQQSVHGRFALVKDEHGLPVVVGDTAEEPIVWASVCDALHIRRFIPLNQLYRLSQQDTEHFARKARGAFSRSARIPGEPDLGNIKRIKGFGSREFDEQVGR